MSAFGPCPEPRNFSTYNPSSSASTMAGREPPSRSGVTYLVARILRGVGTALLAGAGGRFGRDRTERSAAVRPDEDARSIDRQRRGVLAEGRPHAVALQVVFDVRHVERRDRRAVCLDPRSDGAECLRTREVAHDRNDQVLALHRLDEREVLFACEIPSFLA